jgi:hypothetical protein
MVVHIIVVVVDLEDFVDREEIRFVAIANIPKGYHGSFYFQAEFMSNRSGWLLKGAPPELAPRP